MSPAVRRPSTVGDVSELFQRVTNLERASRTGWIGEFITLYQNVIGLEQNGSSVSGTLITGEVVFDATAIQQTNVGGEYAQNTPPVALNGRGISFDPYSAGVSPPSRFISCEIPGWYYVHRGWIINEAIGIPECWFNLSGDPDALGDGGGNWVWVKGEYNEYATMRRHLLYVDETETFPYLINTIGHHECDVHDGVHVLSVSFIAPAE